MFSELGHYMIIRAQSFIHRHKCIINHGSVQWVRKWGELCDTALATINVHKRLFMLTTFCLFLQTFISTVLVDSNPTPPTKQKKNE